MPLNHHGRHLFFNSPNLYYFRYCCHAEGINKALKTLYMSCNCSKANKIPACVTTLTIGTGTANTAYFVGFLSPTGRRDIYQVTADSGGVIAVESPGLRTGTAYQVWVSKLSNANVDVKDAFTPHGETSTVTCIDLEFTECTDADTGGNVELDQTITLS